MTTTMATITSLMVGRTRNCAEDDNDDDNGDGNDGGDYNNNDSVASNDSND